MEMDLKATGQYVHSRHPLRTRGTVELDHEIVLDFFLTPQQKDI